MTDEAKEPSGLCERCGAFGLIAHAFVEGDCVLSHRDHAEVFVGLVCRRHYHWIADTLRQIADLYAMRGIVLLPGPASGGDRHGTRDGSPAPGRVAVMALADSRPGNLENQCWRDDPEAVPDVPGALYSWVRLMAEERDDFELCNINGDVSSIVGRLLRERRWISMQAWIDDYAEDLALLHRHVAAAIGDSMWPKPVGKCPNDGAPLYNEIGVDAVTCRRCKATWTGVHLIRLRLIFEQQEKAETA